MCQKTPKILKLFTWITWCTWCTSCCGDRDSTSEISEISTPPNWTPPQPAHRPRPRHFTPAPSENEVFSEYVKCSCGGTVDRNNLDRHVKTKRHQLGAREVCDCGSKIACHGGNFKRHVNSELHNRNLNGTDRRPGSGPIMERRRLQVATSDSSSTVAF